ncbi:transport permease protein [Marinobacterium zhoushanense]|uniref:Transport permease protein n=1 Tax=Marinobacterium zhoushanense TaxID=1679163 RepID=A0ABQ1KB35_9GAMM|nr:ABC transporter permease [Marinobacterium zhoushanense]GGB92452.1 transport permease protein [Marinobacterium zhoushanense]
MRLSSLLIKELIQFFRDRVILLLILWLYTVEVVICAYALGLDLRHLPLAVLDQDRNAASRLLVDSLTSSESFRLTGFPQDMQQAEQWLQSGRTRAVLVIPPDYAADLVRDEEPTLQLLLDGSDANTAATVRNYIMRGLIFYQAGLGLDVTPSVQPVIRIWYNPDLTYTRFMVLSMIALAALMVGVIHPAATIVREKEFGTIDQLQVTPVRISELFIAKTVPTLLMGTLSVFPSLLIVWWFDVPLRGSLLLFVLLTALFLLSAIGIGVLIAAACRTLQQALLLSFFGLFPMMFLSGTLAPIASMPSALQYLSLLSPLRYYMDVILGIFLKGNGIADLWLQALALAGIGLALYAIAAAVFHRQRT